MSRKLYIDGHAGTTGLRIREWLAGRRDVQLLSLPDAQRKDAQARRELFLEADLALLCLPDDAAREAAAWQTGAGPKILDASSAHRVAQGWTYGLPELMPGQREAIAGAARVTNPGCYPTALVLLLRPLIDAGLLAPSAPVAIHALSGYSGGGRPMIEQWEDASGGLVHLPFEAPYALDRVHKHVPEMTRYARLAGPPQFVPAVGPFRCGMRVQVPLPASVLPEGTTAKRLWETLSDRYRGERFVRVQPIREPLESHEKSFDPRACNDSNRIELHVLPHPSGHVLLIAILDNLGKGAAGVAIQNLNLMLGLDENEGLPA